MCLWSRSNDYFLFYWNKIIFSIFQSKKKKKEMNLIITYGFFFFWFKHKRDNFNWRDTQLVTLLYPGGELPKLYVLVIISKLIYASTFELFIKLNKFWLNKDSDIMTSTLISNSHCYQTILIVIFTTVVL